MEYGFIRPERLWPENNKGYRYILVAIDNLSEYGWTVPLKNKNAQEASFENCPWLLKKKTKIIWNWWRKKNCGQNFY